MDHIVADAVFVDHQIFQPYLIQLILISRVMSDFGVKRFRKDKG